MKAGKGLERGVASLASSWATSLAPLLTQTKSQITNFKARVLISKHKLLTFHEISSGLPSNASMQTLASLSMMIKLPGYTFFKQNDRFQHTWFFDKNCEIQTLPSWFDKWGSFFGAKPSIFPSTIYSDLELFL